MGDIDVITCYIPELESNGFSLKIIENFEAKIASNCRIDRSIEFIVAVLVKDGCLADA